MEFVYQDHGTLRSYDQIMVLPYCKNYCYVCMYIYIYIFVAFNGIASMFMSPQHGCH